MTRTVYYAFTLIELLVVITIIAVLLALLMPAMDKAVYQAELARCAAHQDTVVLSVGVYAVENKRHYPDRRSLRAVSNEPTYLGRTLTAGGDDRPIVTPYLSLKALLCPLAGGNNIDLSVEANDPETYVYSSFGLFFGWGYPGKPATRKIGDRFQGDDVGDRFSVLVADHDALRPAPLTLTAHPDDQGLAKLVPAQNFDPFAAGGVSTGALGKVTVSWWQGSNGRGLIDRNIAYQDGSVERFVDLKWGDPRMTTASDSSNGRADWRLQLPVK